MTADYQVAVPSYQRPQWCAERTLNTLISGGVPPARITVFTHDNDPYADAYADITTALGVRHVQTPARGIRQQREHIRRHYAPGERVVSADDDIQDIVHNPTGATSSKYLRPLPDVDGFIRGMFHHCADSGLYVWGVSPAPNALFLKPRVSEGLKLVMFTLFGFINRPDHPVFRTTVEYKDEQELSLRAYWYDGGTARADGVAVKANYYGPGGCSAAGRDQASVQESQDALLAQWPGLAKVNTGKKSEWPEMRLIPKPRHSGHPEGHPTPGEVRRGE